MQRASIIFGILIIFLLTACNGQTPASSQPQIEIAAVTVTSEPSITPTLEPTTTLTPTIGPTPAGGSSRIAFGLKQRVGEGYEDLGVFLFDLNTQQLTQIAPQGWNLQDVSTNPQNLLINHGQELYISNWDGSNLVLIADNLFYYGKTSALFVWQLGWPILYIGETQDETAIFQKNISGSEPARTLVPSSYCPIEFMHDPIDDVYYWNSGVCIASGICTVNQVWQSSSEDTHFLLRSMEKPLGSYQKEKWIAFSYINDEGKSNLAYVEFGSGYVPVHITLPGDILSDYAWSPINESLAVIRLDRSDYSGKVSGTRVFLYDINTAVLTELPEVAGLNNRVLWSPDGTYLAVTATELTDTGSRILLDVVRVSDRSLISFSNSVNLSSSNFLVITNVYWLRLP